MKRYEIDQMAVWVLYLASEELTEREDPRLREIGLALHAVKDSLKPIESAKVQ